MKLSTDDVENKGTLIYSYFTSSNYPVHISSIFVPLQQVSCKGHNWTIICCHCCCTSEDNSCGTILSRTTKYPRDMAKQFKNIFLLRVPRGTRGKSPSYKQKLLDHIRICGKSNETIFKCLVSRKRKDKEV